MLDVIVTIVLLTLAIIFIWIFTGNFNDPNGNYYRGDRYDKPRPA